MTANPVTHQYWAKLNIWMHKEVYDHGYQAGQQGHGFFSGQAAGSSQQAWGILTFPIVLPWSLAELQKHCLDSLTPHPCSPLCRLRLWCARGTGISQKAKLAPQRRNEVPCVRQILGCRVAPKWESGISRVKHGTCLCKCSQWQG